MRYLVYALAAAGFSLMAGCDRADDTPATVAAEVTPEPDAPAFVAVPTGPVIDAAALGIPMDADSIADGRDIAVHQCSNCHGLDTGESLRADAPRRGVSNARVVGSHRLLAHLQQHVRPSPSSWQHMERPGVG